MYKGRVLEKAEGLSMEQLSKEKSPKEQPAQKKYEAPRLVRYGTFTEITRTSGISAKNKDNALGILKTG